MLWNLLPTNPFPNFRAAHVRDSLRKEARKLGRAVFFRRVRQSGERSKSKPLECLKISKDVVILLLHQFRDIGAVEEHVQSRGRRAVFGAKHFFVLYHFKRCANSVIFSVLISSTFNINLRRTEDKYRRYGNESSNRAALHTA